jgi:predicted amidohydrolase
MNRCISELYHIIPGRSSIAGWEHSGPATALGRGDIGRLKVGAFGDATVLELAEGDFEQRNVLSEVRTGRQRLNARGPEVAGRWYPPRA